MSMEENKKPQVALSDRERFPLLTDLSLLNRLKQDSQAPRFNFESGDRLQAHHLLKVQQYGRSILEEHKFWNKGETPQWMPEFLSWCSRTVSFYKGRSDRLEDQPSISRADISREPWAFVSSDCSLDDLLVYQTSGTTGAPMDVLFDPVSQACWLPQLQSILAHYNIQMEAGPEQLAVALICAQQSTLTYASLSTYLKGAGILKINLNPADWHDPAHRTGYLEKLNPQILTGDPFAFLALLSLKPNIKPKALVSSAMKLTDGIREALENYFQCPVLDIYSLTECRMVAFAAGGRHRAIRPDLYLEILDPQSDRVLPYGERGELTITGGNNPFLPLIRYRTGDYCRLEIDQGIPYLLDLEARQPVAFYNQQGKLINNVDISREMTRHPLAGFTLHQHANGSLRFTGWSDEALAQPVSSSLQALFGEEVLMEVQIKAIEPNTSPKSVTYTSELSLDTDAINGLI